jgi:post-segregation antitoxin (ccd killing protein)
MRSQMSTVKGNTNSTWIIFVLATILVAIYMADRLPGATAELGTFGDEEMAVYGETVDTAREAGIDYKAAVSGALQKDAPSMHTLFWMCGNAGLDTASAEGHAEVLDALLKTLGDDFVAASLARESLAVRLDARGYLVDCYWDSAERMQELKRQFPKTAWALCAAEQAGNSRVPVEPSGG